jgi:uncharacterized membrane protein SpoIIM required for sporulation
MKESKFIEKNKKNWQEFEKDLRYQSNKAKRLSNLFIQITDDLSFARTFYKYRSVKVYLNGIAQVLFNDLYRNQKSSNTGFINFWKYDLPLRIHDARKEFLISFLVFTLSFIVGIVSSFYDKDFARFILGDDYVNMTIENIKNNDPMAVYKQAYATNMFMGITINNLYVALLCFVMGIFFSVGSIFMLIYNGVMVGAFQYFFIERGLFKESFLTIWQHGTLEISCIIIAGAAGIALGKGFLFPGTFKRTDSFKISALRGLKIFIGIAPIIVIAAFIEGFLTRHTDINDILRLMVIVFSLLFMVAYFVWYPGFLSKRKENKISIEKAVYREPFNYDFSKILSAEEIMGYTIRITNQSKVWIFAVISIFALIHALATCISEIYFKNDEFVTISHSFLAFFQMQNAEIQFFTGILTVTLLQFLIFKKLKKILQKEAASINKNKFTGFIKNLFSFLIASLILLVPFHWGTFWGAVSILVFSPFIFMVAYVSYLHNLFLILAIPKTISILSKSWGKLYWNCIKISALLFVFFLFLNTPLVWHYVQQLYENFNYSDDALKVIEKSLYVFFVASIFITYYTIHCINTLINYYAFNETVNADNLINRINKFGERNIMFGFEKE